MEKSTKSRKTNKKPEPVVHLQPGTCPGREYFERREKKGDEQLREVLTDVLGDLPKRMQMANDNRIWLWLLTLLALVDTAMILSLIVTISRIPK